MQKQKRVWRIVTRLVDAQTPNRVPDALNHREFERYSRCLPVFCFPLVDQKIDQADVFNGVTRDFSDGGTSVIADLNHVSRDDLHDVRLICGFWCEGPMLLDGSVCRHQPFGAGLSEIGIQFIDVVESTALQSSLAPFLEQLNVG